MNDSNSWSKKAFSAVILQFLIVNDDKVDSWKFHPGRTAEWRRDLQVFFFLSRCKAKYY